MEQEAIMRLGTTLATALLATVLVALQAGLLLHGVARPLALALQEGAAGARPAFEEQIVVLAERRARGS